VHNSTCHTTSECQEIKKLTEQFCEKMQQQQHQDGAPSYQRRGKQKVHMEKDEELEFQDAKRALKAVYGNSDSESSDNECSRTLHVMLARRHDLAPRNHGCGASTKSSAAPWVDGDADWVRHLRLPQEHGRS
jgi:hypothetical protein